MRADVADFDELVEERIAERIAEIMESVYEIADRLDGAEIALPDSVIVQMVEANRKWNNDAQMAEFGRAVIIAVEQIAIRPSVIAAMGESVDDGDIAARRTWA
jgi:hypothetical protein